jgi:hypothetical protein
MTTIDSIEFPEELKRYDHEWDYEAEQEYRRWANARFTPAAVEEKVAAERLRRAEAVKWQAEHDEVLNENILSMLQTEFPCIGCTAQTEGRWTYRGQHVAMCVPCARVVQRHAAASVAVLDGKTRDELVERLLAEFPDLIET